MNNWVVINRILPEIKFGASFQVDLVEKKLKLVPLEIDLIQTTRLLHFKKESEAHHFRFWVKSRTQSCFNGLEIGQKLDGRKFGPQTGWSLDMIHIHFISYEVYDLRIWKLFRSTAQFRTNCYFFVLKRAAKLFCRETFLGRHLKLSPKLHL